MSKKAIWIVAGSAVVLVVAAATAGLLFTRHESW